MNIARSSLPDVLQNRCFKEFLQYSEWKLVSAIFYPIFLFFHQMRGLQKLWKMFFFYLLFGCPTANFGPLSRGQPHSPNVNHCSIHFQPQGHREPRNKVGSLSPAEHLVGFEPRTFRFLLQHLNPLGHSDFSFHLKSSFRSPYI